ncbi:hypothetical protein LX32DRAFT_705597 [Colletotrichum zoysiae]|uniref:Rhodopsin domain-containing protein n=1 Tax=Colletotrichum zoysiae TaxID=1216348 RepID=A0AAD9H9T4_9PEZI|nr:hypothetical protein LX32DRAFT_705597 [Colletotrichum zoysiae]
MALDFFILILPIPLLFSKGTIRRTKYGLLGLFCIGVTINVIAAWRIVANKATSDQGADPMWIFPPIILLGETENRLSLALASIPVFWPVVTRTWQKLVIVVTHEINIESTQRPPNVEETDRRSLEHGHVPIGRAITEDEANEAGMRYLGRIGDVGGYERGLISPFAESRSINQILPDEYFTDPAFKALSQLAL